MSKAGALHIGTSGWHYKHWVGPFYPEDTRQTDYLSYYAQHFETAEINNSFYRLPSRETFESWKDTVPEGFTFAVKASRYITHMKKLKDPEEPLANLYERVAALGETLGPILFQLPPRWNANVERLERFIDRLSDEHRHVFEFRDPSWYAPEVLDALSGCGSAFCIYELDGHLSPKEVTSDFVYVRLRGPGAKYQGRYDPQTLSGWAGAISTWRGEGLDVYCYFDNDDAGYAAENALALKAMLEA